MNLELETKGKLAKGAARVLANLSTAKKDLALEKMAGSLLAAESEILEANQKDVQRAKERGLRESLVNRLVLGEIEAVSEGLLQLVKLSDPVGEVVSGWTRPNGLQIQQVRVPLGVVGMIYEARPNVTVDAAGLCIKAGNAVILRGGSEAIETNKVLVRVMQTSLKESGLPEGAVQLVEDTDREVVNEMLKLNQYLDVLIPRGGAGLIRLVVENATVPVIETGIGNCHVFVDRDADLSKAIDIVVNSKTQKPGVCNAAESLLIDSGVAKEFLPKISKALQEKGVELRGCDEAAIIVPGLINATEEDWKTEYLDLVMAVKVVNGLEEALEHIDIYGTKHSEVIVTENYSRARRFLQEVDAAAVYVNASTRFTDGGRFGFGAEIGISTQKLHARGPMGLKEMTSTKYIIFGDGQIV